MGWVFWRQVLQGALVAWPGIGVSVWLGTRHVKRHVDRQTRRQTGDITSGVSDITDAQTRVLLGHAPGSERPA